VIWQRRYAFLLGLTGAAGAIDALAFTSLGKVFNSFHTGNVLFIGLGVGQGDWGLVVRAGAALLAFLLGAAAGARLVGTTLSPRATRRERGVIAIEAALLAAFAGLWLATGTPADHPAMRVVLLAVGGAAMGIQAAISLALKIPNVVTVALTATVAELGRRAGLRGGERRGDPDQPATRLLVALALTYTTCAVAVAILPQRAAVTFLPLLLLAAGVGADAFKERQRSSRATAASTAAAFSSRSSAAR
jgi:uncharacterized membrane protein YoaK (UPF0700 family)